MVSKYINQVNYLNKLAETAPDLWSREYCFWCSINEQPKDEPILWEI